MTEAARLFREEVGSRSRISRSVHNKKHGSSTQKLGNRRMSWQEIAGKHGPVSEWCLKDFLNWDIFIQMPDDLKTEYVDRLCDEYDISIQHVSQYLFNKGGDGLRAHLRNNRDKDGKRLFDKCNSLKPRGNTGLLRFQADISEWKRREAIAAEIDRQEEELPVFMTWDEFKKLAPEEGLNFINTLLIRYGIGYSLIAKELFHTNAGNVYNWFRSRKIVNKLYKQPHSANKDPDYKEKTMRFKNDIEEWRTIMEKKLDNNTTEDILAEIIGKPEEATKPMAYARIDETNNETIDIAGKEIEPKFGDAPVEEEKPEQINIPENASEPIRQIPTESIMDYSDSYYSSTYTRTGLNMDELTALEMLFRDKKIHVKIEIIELG